jgi:TolA-binding protein
MTPVDIHPEHLIDRARRGLANASERQELAAHLQSCRACALEWRLAEALREPERAPLAPTSAVVDATLAVLLSEGRVHATGPSSVSVPTWGRAFVPWAAGLCLFFAGSAAAATLIMAVRQGSTGATPPARAVQGSTSTPPPARLRDETPPEPRPAAQEASPGTGATMPAVAPTPFEVASDPGLPTAKDARAKRQHPPRGAHAKPVLVGPSSDELFERARAAVMRGESQAAVALYLTLQERFAASSPAQVSRVLLGRLYLEQLHAPSEALRQFDAYLERAGENRPEALLGRARALRALGRTQDEVETLRRLVEGYPGSLYVAAAQQRLRSIR